MAPQSSSRAGTTKHYFPTTLPPQTLLNIIEQALAKSHLDHVHTSKFPRNFIKLIANRICNEVIPSRFPFDAAIIESRLEAGWLVPPHDLVTAEEGEYSGSQCLLVHRDRKNFGLLL
jgi:hypothetical protein